MKTGRQSRWIYTLAALAGFASMASAQKKITYDDHLKPLFRDKCLNCHNPDKRKGDLDLSSYSGMMAGSSSGDVVDGRDPELSMLYRVVAHLEKPHMPPKKPKLPAANLNMLKAWVAGGALENNGSKARVVKKRVLKVALSFSSTGKPKGPPPMPTTLLLDPVIRTKRTTAIRALAHSPWAPLVAIGGQQQVLLYNSKTLQLVGVLPFPEGDPAVVRFSRNGSLIMVAGGRGADSGRAVVFDVKSGKRVTLVGKEYDTPLAADLSGDQRLIVMGGPAKLVKLYDVNTGELRHRIKKHTEWVMAAAFSPDAVLLATGDRNGGLLVWEANTGEPFFTLKGHSKSITDLAWRDDGNVLVSASEDGTVRLWNMADGRQIKSFTAHSGGVLGVHMAHNNQIATSGRNGQVYLWDGNGKRLKQFRKGGDLAMRVVIDHESKRTITADFAGKVYVYDNATGKQIGTLDANPPTIGQRLAALRDQLKKAEMAPAKLAAAVTAADKHLKTTNASLAAAVANEKKQNSEASAAEGRHKSAAKRRAALSKEINKAAPTRDRRAKDETAKAKVMHAAQATWDKAKTVEANEHKRNGQLKNTVTQKKQAFDKAQADAKAKANDKELAKRSAEAKKQFDAASKQLKSQASKVAAATGNVKKANQKLVSAKASFAKAQAAANQSRKQYQAWAKESKALDAKRTVDIKKQGTALAEAKKLKAQTIPALKKQQADALKRMANAKIAADERKWRQGQLQHWELAAIYTGVYKAQTVLMDAELAYQKTVDDLEAARAAADGAVDEVKQADKFIGEAPKLVKTAETKATATAKTLAAAESEMKPHQDKLDKFLGESNQVGADKSEAAKELTRQPGRIVYYRRKLKERQGPRDSTRNQLKPKTAALAAAGKVRDAAVKKEAEAKKKAGELAKAHQQKIKELKSAEADAKAKKDDKNLAKISSDKKKQVAATAAPLKAIQKQILQLTAAIKTATKKFDQAKKSHAPYESKYKRAEADYKAYAKRIADAQKLQKELTNKVAALGKRETELVKIMAPIQKGYEVVRTKLAAAKLAHKKAAATLASARSNHTNAPKRLTVARSQISQTAKEAKAGETTVAEAKKKVAEAKSVLAKKATEYQKAAGN
jgi:WD40 repeat protein/chromosome segregation ATPase